MKCIFDVINHERHTKNPGISYPFSLNEQEVQTYDESNLFTVQIF